MIVRRLIAAHYGNAVFHYLTVKTVVDSRAVFLSKGTQMEAEGWRKVIFSKEKEKGDVLPDVKQGEKGIVKDANVKEGKTQPPKRYTEGQLITLMKTAGKYIEDGELEKVMAEVEGLGTEATRPASLPF